MRREDLIAFMKEFGMPLPKELREEAPLVLIVDDEVEVLDVLVSGMLSGGEPLEVLHAQSGVEALLLIGGRKPDLVILDIMMPGMDGFEICGRLKRNPSTRSIKIVAITGNHDPAIRDRILHEGADLFFTKPLNIAELRSQCLELLKQ